MESKNFKKENRMAACTQPPWNIFISTKERPEILRKIRQECIDIYGYSLDECPKRKICIKKECLGRPLPYDSKTAKPYIEKLEKTQNIVNGELFINTNCTTCPIFKECNYPCNQVVDFIDRDKSVEPYIIYKEKTENLEAVITPLEPSILFVKDTDIPWDILSEKKKQIVKKYLYEERDFRYIAESLDMNNQARVKYEFYSALTKLTEYGIMRKFIKENIEKITDRQKLILEMIYFNNMSQVETARWLGISKQSIQQTINRVVKKHKIKWKKFVRKEKNKPMYNTLEVLK